MQNSPLSNINNVFLGDPDQLSYDESEPSASLPADINLFLDETVDPADLENLLAMSAASIVTSSAPTLTYTKKCYSPDAQKHARVALSRNATLPSS